MKKVIAILLVAMMALSLVACGEKPAPTPDPTPSASTYNGYFHERHRCRG